MSRPCVSHHHACDCREARLAELAEFFAWAVRSGPWDGGDLDGASIQEKAEELGLLVRTTYDPAIHGESGTDVERGDTWFVFAPDVRAMIAATEETGKGEGHAYPVRAHNYR